MFSCVYILELLLFLFLLQLILLLLVKLILQSHFLALSAKFPLIGETLITSALPPHMSSV